MTHRAYYRSSVRDFVFELRDALQTTLEECFPDSRANDPPHVQIRAEMLEVHKEFDAIKEVLTELLRVIENVIKREFPDNYH